MVENKLENYEPGSASFSYEQLGGNYMEATKQFVVKYHIDKLF